MLRRRRMRSLINDLLAYSRISSKDRHVTNVELSEIVRDVIADLEVRLTETGGRVDVAPLPPVRADVIHMRQLFQNLISNCAEISS